MFSGAHKLPAWGAGTKMWGAQTWGARAWGAQTGYQTIIAVKSCHTSVHFR